MVFFLQGKVKCMNRRSVKIMRRKAGGTAGKNAEKYSVNLPAVWLHAMGLSKEDRVELSFDGEKNHRLTACINRLGTVPQKCRTERTSAERISVLWRRYVVYRDFGRFYSGADLHRKQSWRNTGYCVWCERNALMGRLPGLSGRPMHSENMKGLGLLSGCCWRSGIWPGSACWKDAGKNGGGSQMAGNYLTLHITQNSSTFCWKSVSKPSW